jgi:hypothetical protein
LFPPLRRNCVQAPAGYERGGAGAVVAQPTSDTIANTRAALHRIDSSFSPRGAA